MNEYDIYYLPYLQIDRHDIYVSCGFENIIEFKAQGFNSTQLAELYKLISSDMSDLKIHILHQVTNGDGDIKHKTYSSGAVNECT